MTRIRHPIWAGVVQVIQTVGIGCVLLLVVWLAPAIAQVTQPEARAPIVIDGQTIFQVSDSGQYTAEERATLINTRLNDAIAAAEPAQLSVVQRNQLPTLLLNDQHLLTVTDQDIFPGQTQLEQARFWARQLDNAIDQAQQERTAEYLQRATILAAGAVAIALVIHLALGWLWQHSLRPTLRKLFPPPEEYEEVSEEPRTITVLLNLLLAIARTIVWLATTFYVTNLFPLTRQWSYRVLNSLIGSFTAPIFTLGQAEYSVIDVLILAGLLFGLIIFAKTATDLLKSRVLRLTGVSQGAQEAVAIIVRYGLIFIGTLVVLQIWGLDISSLAIIASALGVGIGFGLQDIAKNFGSGLVLVFERPIQAGDFIEIGGFMGTVDRIGARSTVINTLDHVSLIVPNSRFLEEEVINWSHGNPVSRLRLPLGVAYGSDLEVTRTALLEAARNHPNVLSMPKPQVFFKGFGDSSLNLELLVWTAEPSKQVLLRSDLYFRIDAALRQHQVEVPFPQRDLHVRSGNMPLELSPQLEQVLQHWLNSNGQASSYSENSRDNSREN